MSSSIRRKVDGLIDEVIEPVMNELGYEVEVSHRINDSGTMTAAIISRVYNCDLAIANLTGNNPNVMYEVALRHASAKPIIHITENITDLPFDVNDQRTIPYIDDMYGARELKEKLKNLVTEIDFNAPVNNPVTDALGKKEIVNVPNGQTVEFMDLISDLKDEIRSLKRDRDISLYKTIEVPQTHTMHSEKMYDSIINEAWDNYYDKYLKRERTKQLVPFQNIKKNDDE